MKKRYSAPVVQVSDEKFVMNGISAEVEPGTATVAAAGITTASVATTAVITKHCW